MTASPLRDRYWPMDIKIEERKKDHIDLALKAQLARSLQDARFFYEPLLSGHPLQKDQSLQFFGKTLKHPFWISSMTGGTGDARIINQNLAKLTHEFGMGMGLGSCRILLNDDSNFKKYFPDFNLRPIIGNDLPFFANLGIAQVESLIALGETEKIVRLLESLCVDGIIVHINPLQEWFQPEGDKFVSPPLVTLEKLTKLIKTKIIVKEVGQGMGPHSLKALLELPIEGIELAGLGGTNFTKLEQLRAQNELNSFAQIGHTAKEMIQFINDLSSVTKSYQEKQIIISGGIENALEGYYLKENLKNPSVIGMAKNFLVHASNYDDLKRFAQSEVEALMLAKAYLLARPLTKELL